MSFLQVIFRGLWRRPVRTGLTVLGISIGIAAVVALVGMSSGYEKSVSGQLDAIGIDVIVSNMQGGIMPKAFDESVRDRIAELPGVAEANGTLMQMLSVEDAPMMVVYGREWGSFTWDQFKLIEGRLPRDADEPAVVLGKLAAEVLRKKAGDRIQVETGDFEVVGIVDGQSVLENGAVNMPLPRFQEVSGYDGRVNFINIRVPGGSSPAAVDELCRTIEEMFPGLRAVKADQVVGTSQGFQMARAMSWSTSLLALVVGVLGVMNTMLMSVFERKHEIGVLLALGWRRSRIMALILCESAAMGFLGGIVGVVLGSVTLAALQMAPAVRGFLEPDLGWGLAASAISIAVGVGVISGLYPAWRSSRLSPGIALQG
ncbi:MAG: ABC transporter permease [Chthoniobacterales bacterium]|nr:ABC transporter permease [Chthoniobacterales bacterium]